MLRAITRDVSRAIGRCELTHLDREPIDLDRARAQHAEYERALERLGCTVERLPEEPTLPDSVFVEDAAIVLDEVAVILRSGALSRRPEAATVERALARYRNLVRLEGEGTVDGGDVIVLPGRRLVVGRSSRSSSVGVRELARALAPYGYSVATAETNGCLHLKTAATRIADDTLLLNPEWLPESELGAFAGLRRIEIDPGEPFAANAIALGGKLVYPAEFPRTAERLARAGFKLELVQAAELAKAEGALTCCSLIFEA